MVPRQQRGLLRRQRRDRRVQRSPSWAHKSTSSITVQEGTPTFTGDELDFSGGANVNINDSLTTTFNNVIGGGSGFNKQGNGTVVLGNAANIYTGDTNINGGVVVIGG